MTETTRHTTAENTIVDRLETSIVGRYWSAAAYEHPRERETSEWKRLTLISLGVVLLLSMVLVAGTLAVNEYGGMLPADDTVAYAILDALALTYQGIAQSAGAITLFLLVKMGISAITGVADNKASED